MDFPEQQEQPEGWAARCWSSVRGAWALRSLIARALRRSAGIPARRGATSIASFSARARAGAPVAMPLRWEELGKVASGHAFDIRNVPARLKRLKSHPWAGIDDIRQTLPE